MSTAAANDPAFALLAQRVRVLHLNRGAERVMRDDEPSKRDELWTGSGYCDADQDVPLYLRVSAGTNIAAELLCSVIGRALGLPIPEPFAVVVERDTMPESLLLDQEAARQHIFGCENVGGADFAQLLREDSDFALEVLLQWKDLVPTLAFDEWTANTDRNLGNILFTAQTLWLIDHAEALGGSGRSLYSLAELTHESFTNKLGMIVGATLDAGNRQQTLDHARDWLARPATAMSVAQAVEAAGLSLWHGEVEQAELIDFITNRLTVTHSLLCQRLGHPQLLLSPPADSGGASVADEA